MPKQQAKSIDEVRQEWLPRAEALKEAIIGKYYTDQAGHGSAGREGLGIYGIYQERLARKKIQLAVKLLKRAGFEVTTGNIQKVTRQRRDTIAYY